MVTSRHPNRLNHIGRAHLGIIECALALSVIVGLGFVTLRIMSMPTTSKTADASAAEVSFPPPPPAADAKIP